MTSGAIAVSRPLDQARRQLRGLLRSEDCRTIVSMRAPRHPEPPRARSLGATRRRSHRSGPPLGLLLGSLLGLPLIGGCPDLDNFALADGEVYRGIVVGVDDAECTPDDEACSFIRRGFPVGAELELTFDPSPGLSEPGRLSIRTGCEGLLDDASLRVIEPLEHDQLSLFDFPGGRRLRNYIFAIDAESGPFAGRNALAFVSLMSEGTVEVRVLSGIGDHVCAPDDCAAHASGECDYFGLFRLEREPSE